MGGEVNVQSNKCLNNYTVNIGISNESPCCLQFTCSAETDSEALILAQNAYPGRKVLSVEEAADLRAERLVSIDGGKTFHEAKADVVFMYRKVPGLYDGENSGDLVIRLGQDSVGMELQQDTVSIWNETLSANAIASKFSGNNSID